VALLLLLGLVGCLPGAIPLAAPSSQTGPEASATGELARPRVAERDPGRPRYVRDDWQPHGWADIDGDGCNTRAEVLLEEATGPVARTGRCTITAGEWEDRYTGRRVTVPAELQIDHLVALSDAHASGGWAWSPEQKVSFTNDMSDPDELNAVWGPENQRKADEGPDGWLPPEASFRCAYVAAYMRIKARWDLTVTPSQSAAATDVWSACMTPAAGSEAA
jgi:hypothetical protein